MVTILMWELPVTMLFNVTHQKYHLMKRKHSKKFGDEIASNIWKNAMSTFNEKIHHHFHQQVAITNHIYVGLNESPTNVCQLNSSKNYFIKPHVDSLDLETSTITWFISNTSSKGQFSLHQYLYKFQTNNELYIFVKIKKYVHGILHFDTRENVIEIYTLRLAFKDKKWLKTKVKHQ